MAVLAAVGLQEALSASFPPVRALKTLQLLHFGQGSPWTRSGSLRPSDAQEPALRTVGVCKSIDKTRLQRFLYQCILYMNKETGNGP
jgi:hypothetical protein